MTTATKSGFSRNLLKHAITWKVDVNAFKLSSPQDYQVEKTTPTDLAAASGQDLLPYCFNPFSERLIYTLSSGPQTAKVFAAPFLFMGQRLNVSTLLSVPFERVHEVAGDMPRPPRYIFSPGRAGSTLLSRLLTAVGSTSVSEPDLLTQFCLLTPAERILMNKESADLVIRACVAALSGRSTAAPFLKLRSQCTNHAELLVGAIPGSRVSFIFRGVDAWAASRHTRFNEPPQQLVNMLVENITMLDRLHEQGLDPVVLTYEGLLEDTMSELRRLGCEFDVGDARIREAVNAIRTTDSQEGSRLRRDAAKRPADDGFLGEFRKHWNTVKPWRLMEKHGLSDALS